MTETRVRRSRRRFGRAGRAAVVLAVAAGGLAIGGADAGAGDSPVADVIIRKAGGSNIFLGEDVYGNSGKVVKYARRGDDRSFDIRVYNDGPEGDVYVTAGDYLVCFRVNWRDVANDVDLGSGMTYAAFHLAPNEYIRFELEVRVRKCANKGDVAHLYLFAEPTLMTTSDLVRAKARFD